MEKQHDHNHQEQRPAVWPSLAEVEATLAKQQQRRDIATLGAYALHGQYDGKEIAGRSMATRLRHLRERLDPSGELGRRDPQALARRVESALAEEMARLRLAKATRRANGTSAKQRREAQRAAQAAAEERARAAMRESIIAQLRQVPPDDMARVGTLVLALQALEEQSF